ncbi:MAG: ABC transporter substrate-binding protein [Caldilineaceae bacterium]
MKSARIYLLLVFTLLLGLLAGCAAPVAPAAAPADAEAPAEAADAGASTLVVAISEDTVSLDPARAFETLPTIIHKATYETLVTFNGGDVSTVVPGLASAWTISEDGLTYTFTLREGATFSDGSPVEASDVAFSLNRMANLKGNPSFLFDGITSVEAAEDGTVVLTLAAPDPAILAKLVFGAFSITNQEVVEANGGTAAADAAETDTAEQFLNSTSAGSGPYVLESWEPAVETVLVRNENYTGPTPAQIERVIIRNIPEAATQKIQLEAGDVDIAFDLSADQAVELEGVEGITVYQGPSDTLVFLKGNMNPEVGGPASDMNVLRAVRLALDYEGIRALAGGQAVTPAAMLPVGFLGAYEANLPVRDLDGARAALAEAGYADGLDIELVYPDFTFAGVNFGTFAQKIQADLAEAGINATIAPTDLQVALEAYRQGTEPFGLWLWLPDYRDSNNYLEFLPEGKVGGARLQWTDENSDATIQDIRDRGKTEVNPEARAAIFAEMQDYLIAQGPYAPVVQPGLQVGLSSDVQGFVYNGQWRFDLALLSK